VYAFLEDERVGGNRHLDRVCVSENRELEATAGNGNASGFFVEELVEELIQP